MISSILQMLAHEVRVLVRADEAELHQEQELGDFLCVRGRGDLQAEEGRVLRSAETWSLLENGATLQRIRERPDGQTQIFFFKRQQPAQTDRP